MGFEWYLVKEDGTTALLTEHRRDVWSDGNGAYHYDVTMDGSNNIGWESLEADKALRHHLREHWQGERWRLQMANDFAGFSAYRYESKPEQ